MTSIPIPLVVAFLMLLIAASNHQRLKQTPSGRVFALVLYLYAATMVCIGLRWAWDLLALLPLAALFSVSSTSFLYLAFVSLGRSGPVVSIKRDAWHITPFLLVLVLIILAPRKIELVLICTNLVYAVLLIRLAIRSPSSLQLVRVGGFSNAQQALWIVAALLLIGVLVDVAILIDFMLYQGQHAERFVGVVNLVVLLLLGFASVRAGQGRALDSEVESDKQSADVDIVDAPTDIDTVDDLALLERLNHVLIDDGLFADSELNLMRLARKTGIPARTVSRIINTHTGQNMSQWVNKARIDHVCQRLEDDSVTITQAMLDAGFLTKSNFNREFKRVTQCSPSEWRTRQSD